MKTEKEQEERRIDLRIAKDLGETSYKRAISWGFSEEEARQWGQTTRRAFSGPRIHFVPSGV